MITLFTFKLSFTIKSFVFNELHVKSVDVVIVSCFVPISSIILVVPTTKLPVISTFPSKVPPVSSTLLPSSVMILVVPTTKLPVISTFPSIVPPVSSTLLPGSVMILVVPTTKSPVISTLPDIEPPVSSNLLSNADCNPAVCVMDKPLSCMVSCFPCYASSTSPIIGRVIVSTVIEPLTSRSPIILKGKMNAFAFA